MNDRVILLVEDNPDDRDLTMHALKENKILNRVVTAADGAEALEYLQCAGRYAERDESDVPHLILLDLKLPKIGGLEVLERVRKDPKLTLIPVIILTSSKEEEDRLQGYRLRANSYVRKPVDFAKFVEAVRAIGMYWLVLNEVPPRRGAES